MYYILAALFFVVVYLALVKLLSSMLKGCLVTVGFFILVFSTYTLIRSAQEPIILFDYLIIDNFNVSVLGFPL